MTPEEMRDDLEREVKIRGGSLSIVDGELQYVSSSTHVTEMFRHELRRRGYTYRRGNFDRLIISE